MIKSFMSMSVVQRGMIGIIACLMLFAFGYFFVLNYVSTMEDPPLGNTVYILIGTTLSIISLLILMLILKSLYDYKKLKDRKNRKRMKHKLFYLKDSKRNKSSQQ